MRDGKREEEETYKTQDRMPNTLLEITFLYSGCLESFLIGSGLPLPVLAMACSIEAIAACHHYWPERLCHGCCCLKKGRYLLPYYPIRESNRPKVILLPLPLTQRLKALTMEDLLKEELWCPHCPLPTTLFLRIVQLSLLLMTSKDSISSFVEGVSSFVGLKGIRFCLG